MHDKKCRKVPKRFCLLIVALQFFLWCLGTRILLESSWKRSVVPMPLGGGAFWVRLQAWAKRERKGQEGGWGQWSSDTFWRVGRYRVGATFACTFLCVCVCVCVPPLPLTPHILWGWTAESPSTPLHDPSPPRPVPASVPASNCVTYPWDELPPKECLRNGEILVTAVIAL